MIAPLSFLPLPPTFPRHSALEEGRVKDSLRSQSPEIESLLHLEPPTGCHGNATSATQLCSSGHRVWHPPSCYWFSVFAWCATLLPEERITLFQQKNTYSKGRVMERREVKSVQTAILRKLALLRVGPLTLPVFGLMFCICWSQIRLQTILLDLFY